MDARNGLIEEKQASSSTLSSDIASPAALTLSSAAVVATLIAGSVAFAKHEYNKHKTKKHLKQVKEVLDLYKTYLIDIPTKSAGERLTLPPPFDLDSTENPALATALKLNKAIRKDLVKDKSINSDSFLNEYSLHIRNAKTHLLGFYDSRLSSERSAFTRGTENDVTSSILTYLLIILSEHCTRFEGYQADIAYLEAIIKFINAFASVPRDSLLETSDPKKRQRFERLTPVCKELRKAKKLLLDHSTSRSLKSYIDELSSACSKTLIPDLLGLFTKFIVKEEDWQHVDSATPSWLINGIIRPEYKNIHTVLPQREIKIPDSIFKEWLQRATANYLDYEIPETAPIELSEKNLYKIKNLFKICHNFLTLKSPQPQADGKFLTDSFVPVGHDKECRLIMLSKMPTVFEPGSFLLINNNQSWKLYEVQENRTPVEIKIDDVNNLKEELSDLPDTSPEKISNSYKKPINELLTAHRNYTQLKKRSGIFADLATLLVQLTDINNFCKKLSDCIRDLGEIYVTNPNHCNFIFDCLRALSKNINDRIGSLIKGLEKIEEEQNQEGAHDMLIKEQLDLETQLQNKLVSIREKVANAINGALEKHAIHNSRWGDPKAAGKIDAKKYEREMKKKTLQEMLQLMTKLNEKYKLTEGKYELITEAPSLGDSNNSDDSFEEKRIHNSSPSLPVIRLSDRVLDFSDPKTNSENDQLDIHPLSAPLDPEPLLEDIYERIESINEEEKNHENIQKLYQNLYTSLNELNLIAKTTEEEDDPEAAIKAQSIKELAYNLCKKTLTFLNYDKKTRIEEASSFNNMIKAELSMPNNIQILDEYNSTVDKILRALKELVLCLCLGIGFYIAHQRGGFFRTDTRAAAHQLEEAANDLIVKK